MMMENERAGWPLRSLCQREVYYMNDDLLEGLCEFALLFFGFHEGQFWRIFHKRVPSL